MQLAIKTYNNNAVIFGNGDFLNIDCSADACADFSKSENMDYFKKQITDFFGSNIENLENILLNISLFIN